MEASTASGGATSPGVSSVAAGTRTVRSDSATRRGAACSQGEQGMTVAGIQLQHARHVGIERALVLSPGGVLDIGADQLPSVPGSAPTTREASVAVTTVSPSGTLEDVERSHIVATLLKTGWVVEGPHGAAVLLNMHPNTLRSRIKKLGIQRGATTFRSHQASGHHEIS